MRSQANHHNSNQSSSGIDKRLNFISSQRDTANFDIDDLEVPKQTLFGRLKDRLLDLVTEEVEDYPVGINQLNRSTFRSATPANSNPYFKNQNNSYEFRFPKLMGPANHDFTRRH